MTAPSTAARTAVPTAGGPDVRAVRITAAVLCLFGTGVLVWAFYRSLAVFPGATVVAVVLQLPLLIIGFWLLRLARPLRAPSRTWSAAAVTWGVTAAGGCALLANQGLTALWAKGAGVMFASNWSAALTAPLNEELLKLAGVVMIALAAPRAIRGPLDGMIYGALTGLGFQVMENVTYSIRSVPMFGAVDPAVAAATSAVVRVGETGLGSHWTMTAVAGAGIGYLAARGLRRGALPAAACLVVAMAMHFQFDAPQPAAPLKVLINFVVVLVFYLRLRRAYRQRARAALNAQVASGAIPDSDAAALLSRRGRRRQRRATPRPGRDQVAARQQAALAGIEPEAAD